MNDLKICVERVVRPIRATPGRKDRMRAELLAHLTATYEEELSQDGDTKAALDRAVARFGQPGEVRRELQESVPAFERVLHSRLPLPDSVERWDAKWRTESPSRYATRMGILHTAGLLLLGVVIPIAVSVIGQARKPLSEMIRLNVFALATFAPWPFCFFLCWGRFREAICRLPRSFSTIGSAIGWAALTFPVTFACEAAMYLLVLRKVSHFEVTGRFVMFAAIYTSLVPLLVVFCGLLAAREQRRYEEWGSLVVE
jgi:hypothetical protein